MKTIKKQNYSNHPQAISAFVIGLQTGNTFVRKVSVECLLAVASKNLSPLKTHQLLLQNLLSQERDETVFPDLQKLVNQVLQ